MIIVKYHKLFTRSKSCKSAELLMEFNNLWQT